ncbi:MAG: dihydroorotase [Pseudohongiellaceae bacterium]
MNPQQISLTRPDDWHVHFRDGSTLAGTVMHTARVFGRAVVMPNLQPPVVTTEQAEAYRERIRRWLPEGSAFNPLMTLYLTDNLPPGEIRRAKDSGKVFAVKYYPAGATTHSENGVTDIEKVYPVLELMAELGMPLLIHGEVTDPDVDIFDREQVFIDRVLRPLTETLPQLKIVLEHITTIQAVQFVTATNGNVAATITPHHLLFNRNHLLVGGVRPHLYCLPILKRDTHQQALINAATGGSPKFFLGTDSAPHSRETKEASCGCAGIYSAHAAIELYADVFDSRGALDKLENFASHFGADFYGLPRNTDRISLERIQWTVPENYWLGDDTVVPLRAGEILNWRLSAAVTV